MATGESVFWTFSSAAQAVATFVGFLLAGYALVLTMMDAAARADPTLDEIHTSLKRRYHKQLSALVVVTALAVVASLMTIYRNDAPRYGFGWLMLVAGVLVVVAIAGAVAFVIGIIDPNKYQKVAARLTKEAQASQAPSESRPSAQFFEVFVEIERLMRVLWDSRTDRHRLTPRRGRLTAVELAETLRVSEVISADLYARIIHLARLRNLVFHGHVETVSEAELVTARAVRDELAAITRQ